MQRVIQNRVTRAYLAARGGWTINYSEAAKFADALSLIRQAQAIPGAQLDEVMIVAEEPSPYDIVLPLRI